MTRSIATRLPIPKPLADGVPSGPGSKRSRDREGSVDSTERQVRPEI